MKRMRAAYDDEQAAIARLLCVAQMASSTAAWCCSGAASVTAADGTFTFRS